jgi:uncharacterized protein YeaO (DUF488 family)
MQTVHEHLANGPVLLLCVCRDVATCHRLVILESLRSHGYATHDLTDLS